MNQPHLHKLLKELHGELLEAQTASPQDRDLLEHLAEDIRAIVEGQSGPAGGYHP